MPSGVLVSSALNRSGRGELLAVSDASSPPAQPRSVGQAQNECFDSFLVAVMLDRQIRCPDDVQSALEDAVEE